MRYGRDFRLRLASARALTPVRLLKKAHLRRSASSLVVQRAAVGVVCLLCLLLWTAGGWAQPVASPPSRRTPVVEAIERQSPAVVNVSTDIYERRPAYPFFGGGTRDPFFDEFYDRFFAPQLERRRHRQSLGSGVVIDAEGHILTNHHVVLRASEIHVTLVSGKEYEAELVGSDPGSDLSVLKIVPEGALQPIRMGQSGDLMIGETVIAIGNPFGLSHSVTTGVISAVNRSVQVGEQVFRDFIQTDASINPGNSWGPLLRIDGACIGINTAIYSQAQGIGFAIPIDRVRRIVDDLIEYGEVQPAWFGIDVQPLDEGIARYLGYDGTGGVLISSLNEKGPAARAGLRKQDILVEANGSPLAGPEDLDGVRRGATVNDSVTFRVFRKGKYRDVTVKGTALPEDMLPAYCLQTLGIRVADLRDRGLLRAGVRGVRIDEVLSGSQAAQVGLRPGDVLLKMNGDAITDVETFNRTLARIRCRSHVTLQVLRGRYLYYVTLNLAGSRS